MDYQLNKKQVYLRKLVSNSKAIITNHIAIPLGVRKMNKIRFWLGESELLSQIDLQVFDDFEKEIHGLPVGSERLLWEKEALKKQDEAMEIVLVKFRDKLIDKCQEIIEVLDLQK